MYESTVHTNIASGASGIDLDLIFFSGEDEKLWESRQSSIFWPTWLPVDLYLPLTCSFTCFLIFLHRKSTCRITTVKYKIEAWEWKSLFPLIDQSASIICQLEVCLKFYFLHPFLPLENCVNAIVGDLLKLQYFY